MRRRPQGSASSTRIDNFRKISWIMDQDAGWRPCQFQLANWAVHQEPASEVCCPAAGLPVEYASIDMFGSCSLPACVPHSWGGQHLVEYHYSAASQLSNWHSAEVTDEQNRLVAGISSNKQVVDLHSGELKISNDTRASGVFEQVECEIKADIGMMKKKMHRYPASLQALEERYTVPRYVAIGPYHHHRVHLKKTEKVKHAAAIRCVRESGHLLEDMFSEVASTADKVRHLYDKDVMAGIGYDDFRHMMFFDACFLVQYMRMQSVGKRNIDPSLRGLLGPNRIDILHDVMLLENQLPWKVVETVLRFRPVPLELFIYRHMKGYLQDRKGPKEKAPPALNKDYKPPHLLGFLRYYTVGRSSDTISTAVKPKNRIPISVSAIELAKIGITLKANKTMELVDMGLKHEGTLFAELSMAPLEPLDRDRASYLVNMVAFELCTVESFSNAPAEDSAVCSYLLLMAMLVNREEDVQELRAQGLLKGGGGLTNEEALHFFTCFQSLRFGRCYNRVIRSIEIYKENRRMQTKLYAFCYNNKKIIAAVLTGIGALVGIIGALLSIKKSL